MDSNQHTSSQKYTPTDADYEKAEMDLLRDALKRTYKERFLMMTTLMKMNMMMRKAKIIRTPYNYKISMKEKNQGENINELHEEQAAYTGFINLTEDEKLKRNMSRSPMEKLHLFTRMLIRETLYKQAKIIQK